MLPELKVFDANQPMQNYLAGRENVRQINRQEAGDKQNALLMAQRQEDRSRNMQREDNALSVAGEDRRIKRAQDMEKQISEAVASEIPNLNTDLPDDQYQEQAFQFGDGLGSYLSKVYGMPKEEVTPLVKRALGAIGNKERIKAYQVASKNKMAKEGQTTVAAGSSVIDAQGNVLATAPEKSTKSNTSSDFADLSTILGRPPTMAELKEYKKTGAKGGDEPAEVQTWRAMVQMGIAKDEKEAYELQKLSRVEPAKLVMSWVTDAEKAQAANYIEPGAPGYKDRETLVNEAWGLVNQIRGGAMGGAVKEPVQMASSHSSGNALTAPKGGQTAAKVVTKEIATKFLEQAGGDKAKAREMAKQQGYSF
ncbi:MAG: hypothetical protein WA003_15550 [Desulfuromonadaceae bacterium]